MEKNYFAAIEFGKSYMSVLVESYHHDTRDVVAKCKIPNTGFNDGEIVDEAAFNECINNALNEIISKYKIVLDEVILVLPNNEHKRYAANASARILTERQIIKSKEINQVRNKFKEANFDDKNEIIIDEVPALYLLDGNRTFRSAPIGYQSSTLTIKSNLHCIPKTIYTAIEKPLKAHNIKVLDSYLNCLCGAIAVSEKFGLESNCIHVNIGQEVTTISSFAKGLLINSDKINFGVDTLIEYLANQLKVSKEIATNLFESYFICNVDAASDIIFDNERNLSEKRISGIVLNRLYGAFAEILNKINDIKESIKGNEETTFLVTGLLNDYSYFVDVLNEYTELTFVNGVINIIGIHDQAYVNCDGAIKLFIDQNQDLIKERLIGDSSNEISLTETKPVESTNKNEVKKSRFQDIFDD